CLTHSPACRVCGWAARVPPPQRAAISGPAARAAHGAPAKRRLRDYRQRDRAQRDEDEPLHQPPPFCLAGAFVVAGAFAVAGGFSSICTAPSGGWNAKSASEGWAEKS